MSETSRSVFINRPFDEDYRPSLEALLFTIAASGYRARCALEENDSGDIRLDKLCRLIEESDLTIHDLSRTELSLTTELPRFNMPFELGVSFGAKRFGGRRQKQKRTLIMVSDAYKLPAYLSDLGGNDPEIHGRDPVKVIAAVRRFLHRSPSGDILPGAQHFDALLSTFRADLPGIAARKRIAVHEVHAIRDYRTYIWCLAEFIKDLAARPPIISS